MRVRIGRALLYGSGLGIGGATLATIHSSGYDPNNVGFVRFGRAAWSVGKIGFDYKKTLYKTTYPETADYEAAKAACHQRAANNLLDLCCRNGGVFIKVGQHIGALDYLLPEEYVETMKVLHHEAPRMPLDDVYDVIQSELGKNPRELFSTFDDEPLGTASLAQVHRATLVGGEEVAVKVQHKFVKKHSLTDIYTMDVLIRTVEYFFPQFEFMWLADSMKVNLPLELSFTNEAKNAEKVAIMFKDYDWLKVPEIDWEYTTDRVLVMEYCPGAHINDIESLRRDKIDVFDVSRKVGALYSKMIFEDGYVHCDPHPGNVLVNKGPDGKARIVLLDHGLYTQLSTKFRYNYSDFWQAIINRDVEGIKASADLLGVGQLYALFACMVTARSWGSLQKGMEVAVKDKSEADEIKENATRYMKEIADVLAFVNRQMILILKTNDLLRNIEHSLGTNNNMSSFIQMSKSCLKTIEERRLRDHTGRLWRLRIRLSTHWNLFKISCYQLYLQVYWSRLGSVLYLR